MITQNKDLYEVRFPYDLQIIQLVKNVPGRRWEPEAKMWTVPKSKLGFLIAQFKGTKYEKDMQIHSDEDINVNASLNDTTEIPDVDISDINLYVQEGKQVFNHQKDMLKFAKWRMEHGLTSGFILADCPGLGKTLQAMLWTMYLKEKHNAKHCLIIACVNSAKYNWREDIIKHTNGKEEPYILGTRKKRDGSLNLSTGSAEKLADLTTMKKYGGKTDEDLPYFLVLNIEAIRNHTGKTYPIANRLIELINEGEINAIVLDEIHRSCFEYDTLIQTDCGPIRIGEIVDNRLNVNVLSYSTTSKQLSYQPIDDWHSYPVTSKLLELVFEEGEERRTLRCTPDHKFYTSNRGWVKASDLLECDEVIFNLKEKENANDN